MHQVLYGGLDLHDGRGAVFPRSTTPQFVFHKPPPRFGV